MNCGSPWSTIMQQIQLDLALPGYLTQEMFANSANRALLQPL